jgi:uncharacterized membrane protein YqjE
LEERVPKRTRIAMTPPPRSNGAEQPHEPEVVELIQQISEDLKSIAQDEIDLARIELTEGMRRPIVDTGAIVLGGVLALIGLGLLCTTVVVALAPLIPALWLRMLIMSIAYFAAGAVVAGAHVKLLRKDAPPPFTRTKSEARRTAEALKREAKRD